MRCFKRLKRVMLLVLLLSMQGLYSLHAQTISLSGEVFDEYDSPMPGVTVVIKGTTNGTITGIDGAFMLDANQGEILSVSFIGYVTQEFTVASEAPIIVKLKPSAELLDDLVVIGYGAVKKDDATGSLVAISSDDFNQGAITSPQDLMVGKTSGIQITSSGGAPGSGSTIRIRGGASLSANNDPLFVIDGVPLTNDGITGVSNPLSTINPDDIETFTVLKDASSTAIYGSRASNGVIIITTKSGKANDRLKVNYSGNTSMAFTNKRIDVFEADEYRELIEQIYGLGSDAYNAMGDASTDWQDEIYRTAWSTDHNVSLSGGLKVLPYRLSFGYNNQNGILKTSNLNRYTLGLNLNPTFFEDHLKVTVNAKGTKVNNRFADEGAIGAAVGFDPTHPVYSGNDSWGGYFQWVDENDIPKSFTPTNPVSLLNQRDDRSEVYRATLNLSLDYKLHFLPQVSAVVNWGMDHSDSDQNRTISKDASWMYETDLIRGQSFHQDQTQKNYVWDMYLKYNETWEAHNFDVMGGYSWQHFKITGCEYDNDFDDLRDPPTKDVCTAGENYLVSFYGRANYSYDNRYLLTATVRRDGTSRFSPDGGNQWGTFPSAALAWKVINEDFMAEEDYFTDLKLRLGWGITGQQDITGNNYVGYPTYTISDAKAQYPSGDTWYMYYRPDAYNPDLKWEETQSYNVGVDFGFLESRLTGSVDYYYRKTTDLINEITVAAGTSFSDRVVSNVGSLKNTGIELNLVGRIINSEDWFWEVSGNFTYNKNEITKLTAVNDPDYAGVSAGDLGSGNFIQLQAVGSAVNSFYVYEQVYDQNERPLEGVYVDQNADGIINAQDRILYGSAAPDYLVGLSSTVSYKKWDLNLGCRAQMGAQIYNKVAADGANLNNLYQASTESLSNKLSEGRNTQFTTSEELRRFSSHWIENADFFRLDNVTLGYNFGSVFGLESSSLKLSLTAQNLFVLSDYSGIDPEVFDGIDDSIYPRPTTIIFGLKFGY